MKKNTLIYILCGVVVALLLALVGILAYDYGKGNAATETDTSESSNTESVESAPSTAAAVEDKGVTKVEEPVVAEPEPVEMRNVLGESDWHLVGTIAGKGVVMDLTNYNGEVHGSYYYSKFGPNGALQLDGFIDGNGNITLDEYNSSNGVYSGALSGRMKPSGVFTGQFTNYNGNTYRVYLKVK